MTTESVQFTTDDQGILNREIKSEFESSCN